jgi:hypothetical protein
LLPLQYRAFSSLHSKEKAAAILGNCLKLPEALFLLKRNDDCPCREKRGAKRRKSTRRTARKELFQARADFHETFFTIKGDAAGPVFAFRRPDLQPLPTPAEAELLNFLQQQPADAGRPVFGHYIKFIDDSKTAPRIDSQGLNDRDQSHRFLPVPSDKGPVSRIADQLLINLARRFPIQLDWDAVQFAEQPDDQLHNPVGVGDLGFPD